MNSVQEIDHQGDHFCSATVHYCGKVFSDFCSHTPSRFTKMPFILSRAAFGTLNPSNNSPQRPKYCTIVQDFASYHGRCYKARNHSHLQICHSKCHRDREHEQHTCASTQCPVACQLCSNTCRHTDHFHGLEADSLHLCGQQHRCTRQCELPGICQVS